MFVCLLLCSSVSVVVVISFWTVLSSIPSVRSTFCPSAPTDPCTYQQCLLVGALSSLKFAAHTGWLAANELKKP
jgi:hypothetical protein